MAAYPLVIDLAGRVCVVVGGGPVAERKVQGLLAAGAVVTVVSPRLCAGLAALATSGDIQHLFDPVSRIGGGACVLGDFVPYTKTS